MLNRCLLICYLILTAFRANSQEQLQHERRIYISPENKVYVNKSQPVYFRLSLSPDSNATSYVLPSVQTPKYANPMYFDAEGLNTLRSPYAVDPVTKKVVDPKRDVLFDVYADGKAPSSRARLYSAKKHVRNGIVYYGKGLKIEFNANDEMSGVDATYVSVNESKYQDVSRFQFSFEEEKAYSIAFYSVDHVGNVENAKRENFSVDMTAPITSFQIIGESMGKVLSSKASIALSATDSLSGVARILYSINDGQEKVYTVPIPMSVLKDGKSRINYYAIDNVGNKEVAKVISASTEAVEEKTDLTAYSFYIDKEPPVLSSEIIGSQHKGKYLYIAKDSRFKINAIDEKSGIAKIMYSIDNALLRQSYNEPFEMSGNGLHTVYYAAVDNVGNIALAQSQQVYVDNHMPVSKISFLGKQFVNRDTLFVTSNTKISIDVNEIGSGIQATKYTLDNTPTVYLSPFSVDKEGFHTLSFATKDNVNNLEKEQQSSFYTDNTAPAIFYKFSTKAIGEKTVRDQKFTIYPSNVMLYIAATDNASGVDKLSYKINGKEPQSNIPLKDLKPGNYEIEIVATDVLWNQSTQLIHFSIED